RSVQAHPRVSRGAGVARYGAFFNCELCDAAAAGFAVEPARLGAARRSDLPRTFRVLRSGMLQPSEASGASRVRPSPALRYFIAASTSSACCFVSTFFQIFLIRPSGPIQNVV